MARTLLVLYTVGHSNHPPERFLELLRQHDIQVLADVRSAPYSRYASHFNREELSHSVTHAGIKYLFLGKELGGRPQERDFYDDDGHVLYDRVAQTPTFLAGIERLEKGIGQFRVAIMCSEENPAICHRHLLVARVMGQRAADVVHIRGDGTLQPDCDLDNGEKRPDFVQGSLFGAAEEKPWKSLRPIWPKVKPKDEGDNSEDVP